MSLNWGNYPKKPPKKIITPSWTDQIEFKEKLTYLVHGNGRSYGDSCLNQDGILIQSTELNHIIHFDKTKGIIRAEAGILLSDLLKLVTKDNWMLPVVPGTSLITLGGAVANDVHGKNHHNQGTFGCHVTQLELMHSDLTTTICSTKSNYDLFSATIGGLGLTGMITWVEIQLMPIVTTDLNTVTVRFKNLEQFYELSKSLSTQYEYTAAWLDTTGKGNTFGRGYFMAASHQTKPKSPTKVSNKKLNIPINFPNIVLNKLTVSLFNKVIFWRSPKKIKTQTQSLFTFLFPLDSLMNWNRIYGKRGFIQYQFVIPKTVNHTEALNKILDIIVESGQSSFLSVLKMFGDVESPGMLSFPTPGITLALDFAYKGEKTLTLLDQLDQIVIDYHGRVYPGKDARMSPRAFKNFYPNWQEFSQYIDPKFSSSFWQRVTKE